MTDRATTMQLSKRLPPWFRVSLATNGRFAKVHNRVRAFALHTVCEGAACPNRNECWNAGTATFLILGDRCTRFCGFCNISSGNPRSLDPDEPRRVAAAVREMLLSHAVVTSVTRDDLADGGAGLFAKTISSIRSSNPACSIEVLVPDFRGSRDALATVLDAAPDVLNHNVETVPSLYPTVRPQAQFNRSLAILKEARARGFTTKSGMMLGLGEDRDAVLDTLKQLRTAGCDMITIGQYLQPTQRHLPVQRYYSPREFEELGQDAWALGFKQVAAGPLVRSSYHAVAQHAALERGAR